MYLSLRLVERLSFFLLRDNIHDRTLIVLTNTDKGVSSDQLWKILKDNSMELSPASVNITYIEWSEELSFPMAEYKNVILQLYSDNL